MRKKGSIVQVNVLRDRELMKAYNRLLCSVSVIRLGDVFRQLVALPCSRFWCSEERAYMVCLQLLGGGSLEKMNGTRRAMFMEIYRRVCELRTVRPTASLFSLVIRVVNSPAPCFYLTPRSAQVIIHHIKKRCLEERKKRLRHLM